MRPLIRNILVALVLIVAIGAIVKRKNDRKRVALAVSATVDHFAKGLVLGEPLPVGAKKLGAAGWRQHVGFVGPAPGGGFVQAILFPSLKDRAKILAPAEGKIEAVELTAATGSNLTQTLSDLSIAFRGVPKQGCIRQRNGDYRLVQYWLGRDDGGGVAVITDMGDMSGSDTTRATGSWSLFAWAGPFKGAETLSAAFEPAACAGSGNPPLPENLVAAATALEAITVAFRDSVRGVDVAAEQHQIREYTNADAPNACDMPAFSGPTTVHHLVPFTIELPSDLIIKDQSKWDGEFARSGVVRYEWSASDGSRVEVESVGSMQLRGEIGGISSQCDLDVGGRKVRVAVGNATTGNLPRLTAGATYEANPRLDIGMVGIGASQQRQRDFLAAARSIRINGNYFNRP